MAARSQTHWLTEAGMFFEKQGPVWAALRRVEERLRAQGAPYVIIGGLALNAHGYPRQTIDVNVTLRPEDHQRFLAAHLHHEYEPSSGGMRRLRDQATDVDIDFLISGHLAGNRAKNKVVRFPDPDEAQVHNDLVTVSLPRLIELKLVTYRYKDWGDVVELIRRNRLGEEIADQIDRSVRSAYLQCYDQAHEEGYEAGSPGATITRRRNRTAFIE